MKTCTECKKTLPLEDFHSNGFTPKGTPKYKTKCKSCSSSVRYDSRKAREDLIYERYGRSCKVCGYDRCLQALEFHHLDESTKEFKPSHIIGNSTKLNVVFAELDKCVLLCANCHREVHVGLIDLRTLGE